MTDLNDIWRSGSEKLPEEMLLAYIEGRLSPEEARQVEKLLAGEGMEADALEGLRNMPARDVKDSVGRLNQKLRTTLSKNKRRAPRSVNNNYWSLIGIIVILLICLAGYIVLMVLARR